MDIEKKDKSDLDEAIESRTGLTTEEALKQNKYCLKATRKVKQVDFDNNQVEIVIANKSVDRDSEVVLPMAFKKKIKTYLDNPVVLFGHNHWSPPVGKMVDYKITEDEFVAIDQFAVAEYDFAALLWRLYSGGYMKAASVGFMPTAFDDDEEKKLPGQRGVTYTEAELLEHSLVPVGSNRNALVKVYNAVKDRMDTGLIKFLEKMIEQPQVLKCGHSAYYDAEGKVIEPCPICAEIGLKMVEKNQGNGDYFVPYITTMPVPKDWDDMKAVTVSNNDGTQWIYVKGKEEDIILSKEQVEKPFENEHSCRLVDPDKFQDDSFRSSTREHNDKEYRVIMGKLEGEDTMTDQAYRYNKSIWEKADAKKHCKAHDGILFEPAEEDSQTNQEEKEVKLMAEEKQEEILEEKEGRTLSAKTKKKINAAIEALGKAQVALEELVAVDMNEESIDSEDVEEKEIEPEEENDEELNKFLDELTKNINDSAKNIKDL